MFVYPNKTPSNIGQPVAGVAKDDNSRTYTDTHNSNEAADKDQLVTEQHSEYIGQSVLELEGIVDRLQQHKAGYPAVEGKVFFFRHFLTFARTLFSCLEKQALVKRQPFCTSLGNK